MTTSPGFSASDAFSMAAPTTLPSRTCRAQRSSASGIVPSLPSGKPILASFAPASITIARCHS
jgi:hypothetical protein